MPAGISAHLHIGARCQGAGRVTEPAISGHAQLRALHDHAAQRCARGRRHAQLPVSGHRSAGARLHRTIEARCRDW